MILYHFLVYLLVSHHRFIECLCSYLLFVSSDVWAIELKLYYRVSQSFRVTKSIQEITWSIDIHKSIVFHAFPEKVKSLFLDFFVSFANLQNRQLIVSSSSYVEINFSLSVLKFLHLDSSLQKHATTGCKYIKRKPCLLSQVSVSDTTLFLLYPSRRFWLIIRNSERNNRLWYQLFTSRRNSCVFRGRSHDSLSDGGRGYFSFFFFADNHHHYHHHDPAEKYCVIYNITQFYTLSLLLSSDWLHTPSKPPSCTCFCVCLMQLPWLFSLSPRKAFLTWRSFLYETHVNFKLLYMSLWFSVMLSAQYSSHPHIRYYLARLFFSSLFL